MTYSSLFLQQWVLPVVVLPVSPESFGGNMLVGTHVLSWIFVALYIPCWAIMVVNMVRCLRNGLATDEASRRDLRELRILLTIYPACFILVLLFGVYAMAPIAVWMILRAFWWAVRKMLPAFYAGIRLAFSR